MLTGALFGLGVGVAVAIIWAVVMFGFAFIASLRPLGWLLIVAAIGLLLWNL